MNDLLFDLRPSPTSFDLVSLKKVLLCVQANGIRCVPPPTHKSHCTILVEKKMAGHKSCCILSFICLFADPGHRRPYLGRSNNENGLSQTASPVQQLTKAFFFYLFRSKGDKIRVSNCVFKNFYHLHATISTRLFFSLTKLLMMISYSITFPENALEIIFGGVPQSGNNTRCP